MIYDDYSPVKALEQPRRKQHKKTKMGNWEAQYKIFAVVQDDDFDDEDDLDYLRKKKARRTRRERDDE
jgi:hypothetical protein